MSFHRIIVSMLLMLSVVMGQTNNDEFRATWVITWEHISASSSVSQNQARIRAILDDHLAANMNAVLFQIRQSGTAYYNSSFEPWGYYAGGSNPGYDPLAYAIEQAHMRGLELHAWFNTFQAASTVPGTPAAEHPEWVCRDQSGTPMPSYRALSPGLPAVREYLVDVAMEIVNNYDIDGLHLDYVRWNEYENLTLSQADPDPVAQVSVLDQKTDPEVLLNLRDSQSGRYLYDVDHPYSGGTPAGYGSWPEFWRASVTDFVQTLHDSIQSQKPYVRLSVAALGKYNWSGWNGYDVVYQDAALWFNQGYIDQLTPMHYHWTTASGFIGMLTADSPYCWGDYIQPGINAGRLYSVGPGSYIFDQNNVWSRHSSVVTGSRTVQWVDGFQFFSYGSWQDHLYWDEAGATFFKKKTKIRDTGIYAAEIPPAPELSFGATDSLTFDLTVTPHASVTQDHWWAVYRSAADDIDRDASDIIAIAFGSTPFTITDAFDGTQDHNASYFYAATMLDRYWNESELSTTVESTVLPSFAPIAASTYPSDGDTVNVNTVIDLRFTKTMDTESVENAFSISPDHAVGTFSWPDGDHRLLIYMAEDFAFLSNYTLTISDAAMDINGVSLDGDGDGLAGGDLVINFVTKEVDEAGPVVVYSTPVLNAAQENFDVDGPISFVFDEQLDPVTVTADAISLTQAGEPVEIDFLLTGFYGRSVLDIKPYEQYHSAADYSLVLSESITDTLGNPMPAEIAVSFSTANNHYSEVVPIDYFTYTGEWWDPEGSGSTVGTIGAATAFGYSSSVYLPGSSIYTQGKKSAYIRYEWDLTASSHLLREYIPSGAPRNVIFDASYTMQVYIYGDGSNNKFRFAIDEGNGTDWPGHEVSTWYTIDWEGWRLIEWDLSDPSMVGSWIGNGALDGSAYRVDSFQLTYDSENGEASGRIFLDNFRVIKRMPGVSIDPVAAEVPVSLALHQNYPNPFNPETQIRFDLPHAGDVSLLIYDIRGREISRLIDAQFMEAGSYTTRFHANDLAAGIYFVRIFSNEMSDVIRMTLLK